MITTRRGLALVTAAAAATLLMGALPAVANDGPVEDVQGLVSELTHCRAWADEPGGDPVIGHGGASCRAVHGNIIGTVCLVYNGVTVASSCNVLQSSTGSDSSPTKPTKCVPGLWQTQTTVLHAHGPDTEVLSDPVLLVCIPPIG